MKQNKVLISNPLFESVSVQYWIVRYKSDSIKAYVELKFTDKKNFDNYLNSLIADGITYSVERRSRLEFDYKPSNIKTNVL